MITLQNFNSFKTQLLENTEDETVEEPKATTKTKDKFAGRYYIIYFICVLFYIAALSMKDVSESVVEKEKQKVSPPPIMHPAKKSEFKVSSKFPIDHYSILIKYFRSESFENFNGCS